MDGYSKLDGTIPIAPVPGRVWAVSKKRRTSDRHGRDRRKGRGGRGEKREEEPRGESLFIGDGDRGKDPAPKADDQPGYGSLKKQTEKSQKVDLVI